MGHAGIAITLDHYGHLLPGSIQVCAGPSTKRTVSVTSANSAPTATSAEMRPGAPIMRALKTLRANEASRSSRAR